MKQFVRIFCVFLACLCVCLLSRTAEAQAVPVQLKQADNGWQLYRDGKPFYIKGAGGDWHLDEDGGQRKLELFKRSGGNSIRTWGVGEETEALLDRAHALGLTVTVGIWLGHERHGFDYTDLDQVAEQKDKVREAVLKFKDHPAVLAWGVGNEMEGYDAGDNAAIWSHVEAVAAMIKRLDPDHPTMTVIAEIGGRKLESIHKLCPSTLMPARHRSLSDMASLRLPSLMSLRSSARRGRGKLARIPLAHPKNYRVHRKLRSTPTFTTR